MFILVWDDGWLTGYSKERAMALLAFVTRSAEPFSFLYCVSVKPPHDLHLHAQYVTILPYSSRLYMQLADTIRDTGGFSWQESCKRSTNRKNWRCVQRTSQGEQDQWADGKRLVQGKRHSWANILQMEKAIVWNGKTAAGKTVRRGHAGADGSCGWNNSNGSGCWCRGGYSFRCGCSHRGNGTAGKVISAIIFFRLALSTAALATSPWDDLTARIIWPTIAALWRSCIIDNGLDYTGYTVLLSICAENQKE